MTRVRNNIAFYIKKDNLQVWDLSNTRRYKQRIMAPEGFVLVSTGTPFVTTEMGRRKGDRKEMFLEIVFRYIKDGTRPADPVDNTKVKD